MLFDSAVLGRSRVSSMRRDDPVLAFAVLAAALLVLSACGRAEPPAASRPEPSVAAKPPVKKSKRATRSS